MPTTSFCNTKYSFYFILVILGFTLLKKNESYIWCYVCQMSMYIKNEKFFLNAICLEEWCSINLDKMNNSELASFENKNVRYLRSHVAIHNIYKQ